MVKLEGNFCEGIQRLSCKGCKHLYQHPDDESGIIVSNCELHETELTEPIRCRFYRKGGK